MALLPEYIKKGIILEPQSADPSAPFEGQLFISDGTSRAAGLWQYIGATWRSIGGGSGGLDVFLAEDFSSNAASSFSSGNNATFMGGGALAGTLANETSSPIAGDRSIKYTQAGGSLNDYIALAAVDLDSKQKGQWVGVSFYYTYNGSDDDIKLVVRDITNGTNISAATDLIKSKSSPTRFSTSVYVPSTCSQIRIGFQTVVANSGKILVFDDVELSTNPFVYKNLIERLNVVARGNAGQVLTANVTDIPFTEVTDTHAAWDGDQFTAPQAANYHFSGNINQNAANTAYVYVYVDGVSKGSVRTSASQDTKEFAGTIYLTAGQVLSFRVDQAVTLSNSSTLHHLNITADLQTEHVVTPATSTLTDWVSYTPTTQGFGTLASSEFRYRRIGDSIEIQGRLTAGTATAAEAQVGLPSGLSVLSSVTGPISCGSYFTSATGENGGSVLMTGGDTFLNFGIRGTFYTTAASALTVAQADGAGTDEVLLTGQTMSFTATVPIQGYSSNVSFLAAVPTQLTALLKDVKSSATDAGGFTSGSYILRDLNTSEGDTSIVSLASNAFTLRAGKYVIEWAAPAFQVDQHHSRLVSDPLGSPATVKDGVPSQTTTNVMNTSCGYAVVEISTATTYGIHHRCSATKTGNGLGRAVGFGGSEVYTQVKITKLR